ncbi:MAG: Bug family tripartite tricarboxylate transporter substrate binding protein [Hyphomicrobiaceae bacterium]
MVAAAACAAFVSLPVVADNYPSRSITLVVPFGAGGAADVSARLLVGPAGEKLGQPVVAVNKTGAAGVIGSTFVVNSPPDGYTMLAARVGSQMGVPAMNKTIPYKWDDFTFIGLTETNPFVLVVPGNSPMASFKDFEAKVKAGEEMTFASAGVGTLLHIATAVMADEMGVGLNNLTHVPFKGGGAANAAIVGGKVDFMWQNLSGVINAIEAGQLKALAITTPKRFAAAKDIPTVSELGYPGMEEIIGWSAVYGPPGLPDNIVAKWTGLLESLKSNDEWAKRTTDLGNVVDIRSPEDTKKFVGKQYRAFDESLKKLGLRVE